jgi:hypothetical protein
MIHQTSESSICAARKALPERRSHDRNATYGRLAERVV